MYFQNHKYILFLLYCCVNKALSKEIASLKQEDMTSPAGSGGLDALLTPILIGVLLKFLALVPIVLFKIVFFGIVALLISKLSLVLSTLGLMKKPHDADHKITAYGEPYWDGHPALSLVDKIALLKSAKLNAVHNVIQHVSDLKHGHK